MGLKSVPSMWMKTEAEDIPLQNSTENRKEKEWDQLIKVRSLRRQAKHLSTKVDVGLFEVAQTSIESL